MAINTKTRSGKRGRVPIALLLICACPAVLASTAPAFAQGANTQRSFDIPAQHLTEALMLFGRQSGLQVTADAAVVGGRSGHAVSGMLTPAEALSRLLTGSGLTFRQTGAATVTLERTPQAESGIDLGSVRVEGSAITGSNSTSSDPAASAGSHSYAAPSVTVAGKAPWAWKEVPQSVSVVTRQKLDDQNLFSIEDALRTVPGITVATSGNPYLGPSYYARGYALTSEYDGVPSSTSLNTGNPQFDLAIYDRIEVLKGSAGLLQGAGEPGGVANFARKRPLDSFHVSGSLSGGSWNSAHADLDVTGPLNAAHTIRGRLVVAGQDHDYAYQGSHVRSGTAYGIVEGDVDPDTLLSLSATIQRDVRHGVFQGLPAYTDGTLLNVSPSFNPDPRWTRAVQTTREIFGEASHKAGGDWLIKASLRYRDSSAQAKYAATNDAVDPATNSTDYFSSVDFTRYSWLAADVNASGSFRLFGRDQHLLVGANYDHTSSRDQYGGSSFALVNIDGPLPGDPGDAPYGDYRSSAEQFGLYGQLRLSPLAGLTAVLGGRLTHYRSSTGSGDYGAAISMVPNPGGTDARFTPYAGLTYDVTSHITLYGSYADIFVPQSSLTLTGSALPPRSGREYELGAKGAWLEDRLHVSAAIFDLQDNHRAYNYPIGSFFYIDTGKVRTRGVEVEATGSPMPGWDITAGYTYLDARYDADATYQGQAFNAAVTPTNSAKLWTTYRFSEGPLAGLNIGGGMQASSSLVGTDVRAPGYAVFSGQVGYRLNAHWQGSVTVNNIGNRRYYQTVNSVWSNNYYGDPRNVMATIRMTY